MRVLIEDMKTKYIHNELSHQLDTLLSSYDVGEIVDLGGSRLGSVASSIIGKYSYTLKFIDSESADWNAVYENNYNITHDLLNKRISKLRCMFPNMIEFMNYVKSDFDVNTVYVLDELSSTNTLRAFSFVVLFILIRPDVNVDISKFANRIFRQIRLDWYYDEDTHYATYYDATHSLIKRTVNSDRTVTIEGIGRVSEHDFLSHYVALPTTFGSERLYKTKEWYDVVRSSTINIDNTEDNSDSTTIADLIW